MLGSIEEAIRKLESYVEDPLVKPSDLKAYLDAAVHTESLNDRYLLLEKLIVLMSRLSESEGSTLQHLSGTIQDFLIDTLYKDLPHPPSSYVGGTATHLSAPTEIIANPIYAARSADGSNYNILFPAMGKAGVPYARSVPALRSIPASSLPDPDLVFDTLLRRDEFKEHPGGISSLFFAFADLVIHSCFNTDSNDWNINKSSSYLDLSILYGSSEAEVDKVRRKDGTGRLWDDVFADSRLLLMPAASCALLVLLCRNHNYIAEKILAINEHGKYTQTFTDEASRIAQDDEIFARTRLVNCGYFMQIILGDYVGAILGLVRDGHSWRLDPLKEIRRSDHTFSPRGEGNVVSVEFNLLYRWHATLSQNDTQWLQNTFRQLFKSQGTAEVTTQEFHAIVGQALKPPADIRQWTFHDLKRGNDGRFKDEDLAKLLQDATSNRAGAFKARGIPEALRVVEVLGINQARSWGTCSLNEFRKFIGLKPYTSFTEWNPDKDIADAAASLYGDIENLELHVGLQAEQTKEPGPGAGLCPGYTISRAILADAVCLTRGDRFLTVDFTPFNLTAFGYQDCQFDKEDGSYGGLLTKLLFRTLPNHYTPRSVYAHFPFLDPTYMKGTKSIAPQVLAKYDWNRPATTVTVAVNAYDDVKTVLGIPNFESEKRLQELMIGHAPNRSLISKYITADGWTSYFALTTENLIKKKSFGQKQKNIDIVRDVINVLPIKWICQEIAGLPLASTSSEDTFTASQYYDMFATVAQYLYVNFDPSNDWHLRESSATTYKRFFDKVKDNLHAFSSWFASSSRTGPDPENRSKTFLKNVYKAEHNRTDGTPGHSASALAASLFCELVPTAAHFSQAIAHVVNYYLDVDRQLQKEDLVKNAALKNKVGDAKVMQYVREALGADPPLALTSRLTQRNLLLSSNASVNSGTKVYASIIDANKTRTAGAHPVLGLADYGLLSAPFFDAVAPRILYEILSLPGITLKKGFKRHVFTEIHQGCTTQMYLSEDGKVIPWPDSLTVQFSA
ncbi:heme peroxidase [Desarmillaria tabescens]|uniref:Heme peroxidase n=1 Tax=Armillaria tabescens TaxID=1929756 RepID=A0AA39T7G9_ARMTA|nr:heme peroxidase [Desarmillaria tabescens]KAK0469796.1 heme peroxidase [Desarmillaria tabescens]